MGLTYQSGIKTSKDRRGVIAPDAAAGVVAPGGVFSGAAPPDRGRLVPKGHSKDSDSMDMGKANRQGILERQGPRFRIEVPLRTGGHEAAAATQANGRIVPPTTVRQDWSASNFWGARGD